MSTQKQKQSGILSNNYIPPLSPVLISKELNHLTTESLFNLVELWLKLPITQPKVSKDQRKQRIRQQDLVDEMVSLLARLKTMKNPKRKLIDRILVDYYPKGLNALQLAQIDIQLMVDKPSSHSWVSSTAKIMDHEINDNAQDKLDQFIFSLDSQSFLDKLINSLSNLYLTHIYISRHPHLPLIIVRLQMYEYVHLKKSRTTSGLVNKRQPDIISRRPYYLAIPTSSPNLIHSAANDDDIVSRIIIQAVEQTLSSSFRQIKLFKNKEAPVRTLEGMHLLKGVSRFGQSLGSWAPYADGIVDISPLGRITNHAFLKPSKFGVIQEESKLSFEEQKLNHRRNVANLRFKGSMTPIQSETLFEDNKQRNFKRKVDYIEITSDGEDDENQTGPGYKRNEYSSLVPIQYGEFTLENKIKAKTSINAPSVKIRLLGNDIFAGLHEMSIKGIVDPENIPSWLTGEEGLSTGVIQDGHFILQPFDN